MMRYTAGGAALVMALAGVSWQTSWLIFAFMSAVALIGNASWLRGVGAEQTGQLKRAWREVLKASAVPLFAVAFVDGMTSAIFIAFAADHMQGGGGVPGVPGVPVAATSALIFVLYWAFGLFGLPRGRLRYLRPLPSRPPRLRLRRSCPFRPWTCRHPPRPHRRT